MCLWWHHWFVGEQAHKMSLLFLLKMTVCRLSMDFEKTESGFPNTSQLYL
jgi:hypothetical protein